MRKTTQEKLEDFRRAADAVGASIKEAIEPVLRFLDAIPKKVSRMLKK